jgi:MFS family permease
LSSRAGALGARIGPRLPMSAGPLLAAVGVLLMMRIGRDASYATDVLPAVVIFGLGLSLLVAPLTSTVLGAAPAEHAGAASGVNNAVARAGGLLAVALLPAVAGLTGDVYRDPDAFTDGFRIAMGISAGLLVVGGLLSAAFISNDVGKVTPDAERPEVEHCYSCPVAGPHLETVRLARAGPPSA